MTRAWIAAVWLLAIAGAAAAVGLRRRRERAATGARAWIVQLGDSTSMDDQSGAVRSVQEADLMIEESALRAIWTPEHLERLARTYWRFLTRVTLGLIRVRYTERERYVVLLARPFKLITFQAPEYEIDPTRGLVRWQIARGLLVSREGRNGRGHLQIEVRRGPSTNPGFALLHVEVEVSNFYPSIASRLSRSIYNVTQSRLHVLITHGFLRSLVHLDLAERRRTGPRTSPPGG